jgi:hypothetical protein
MPATMAKKKPGRPKSPAPVPDTAVIYVEAPPYIKAQMMALAVEHNRKLTGEVIQALQEYLAKYDRWPPPADPSP